MRIELEQKLDKILAKKANFSESIDVNYVISFGMKDVQQTNKKKSKVFNVLNFPFPSKTKNKILVLSDEIEIKNKFDDITITPYETNKLNKKSLKRVNAILSLGVSMSRFASFHKMIGCKKLSPKEIEGTLFKKKEELENNIKLFLSGNKQRICMNLLQKTCILNCSIGNINMDKEKIIQNFQFLENYVSKDIKEFFNLQKNTKILSCNITSTMYNE